ncbi:MAG: MFS transporter [Parcubacteria group bacterium]|nr:MFS transporter [Parcubacteria group bacterium]
MNWLTDIRKYYLYRGLIKRIVVPILFIYFLDQGLTLSEIGSIAAISSIVGIILEVPSGAIADMLGHKRSLVISSLLQGVSMLLYIALGGYSGMLIASIVYWGGGTLMTGTHDAFFYELLEKRKQTHLFKKYWGRAFASANAIGVVLLAVSSLLYVWHPWIPFIAGVGQFILSAIVISSISSGPKKLSVAKEEGYVGFRESVRQNLKLLNFSHPFMWILLYQSMFFGMAYAINEFHQLFLEEVGVLIVYLGIIFAGKRLLTMFSSYYAHMVLDRFTSIAILWLSTGLWLIILMLYAAVHTPVLAAILVIIPSVFGGLLRVAINDAKNKLIVSGSRSSFLSIFNFGDGLVKALGVLIIGLVATQLSVQITLALVPFVIFIPLLIILFFFQKTYLAHKS